MWTKTSASGRRSPCFLGTCCASGGWGYRALWVWRYFLPGGRKRKPTRSAWKMSPAVSTHILTWPFTNKHGFQRGAGSAKWRPMVRPQVAKMWDFSGGCCRQQWALLNTEQAAAQKYSCVGVQWRQLSGPRGAPGVDSEGRWSARRRPCRSRVFVIRAPPRVCAGLSKELELDQVDGGRHDGGAR